MSALAWVVVGFGVLIIVTRAPLIFAPVATLAFYRKLLESLPSVRVLGVGLMGLGAALVASSEGSEGSARSLAQTLGWGIASVSLLFLIILPNLYRAVAEMVIDLIADVARPLGVLAVAMGLGLIWLGIAVVP